MKIAVKTALLSLLLTVSGWSFAQSYAITYKGISAGKAKLSISSQANRYRVELALFPAALAKLSGIDDMVESAEGAIKAGHFYPKSYRRIDNDGNLLLTVTFNGKSAKIQEGEASKTLAIAALGQDPLSQMAQIQHDLQAGTISAQYILVTERNQKVYKAVREGNVVTLTEHPSKNRRLKLWFSDDYQLDKMQKIKKGKVQFAMERISK